MSTPANAPQPGNAKHAAALAARADQLIALRHDITETLAVLADLAGQLEDLASSRQRLRARLVTAETREILDSQTRRDRAAARGLAGRNPDRTLAFMNLPARIGTGQVAAPVQTLPALSVVAEIRYTLRHHIRRLGRPAKLNALEVEQTAQEDHGYSPWPRHPILTARVDVDDHGIDHLAVRLAQLVAVYTNRKDLDALTRDLSRLEEAAKDITQGMPGKSAMLLGAETCPHCSRNSLVVLSRVPGITALVIRCDGTHRCRCDDPLCACHRDRPRRHEWINSGHATHTWHDLRRAQNKLKELLMLETKALAAIDEIRHLHRPVVTLAETADATDYVEIPARFPLTGDAVPADHECNDGCRPDDDNPEVVVHDVDLCGTCGQLPLQTGQEPHESELWPCPTYRAADLDSTTNDTTDRQ